MKLVTFEIKKPVCGLTRIGEFSSDRIIDLNSAYIYYLHNKKSEEDIYSIANSTIPSDMITFLKFGSSAKEAAEKAVEFVNSRIRKREELMGPKDEKIAFKRDEVKLLAPIPRPNTLRDYMGFKTHLETALKKRGKTIPKIWYEIPIYHKGNPNMVAGPDDPILWPSYTNKLDYELELGMYIGKEGVDISKKRAAEYIAGYTIFNDISARDRQMLEMEVNVGPAKGKDFNNSNIMGPCLVTADEIHSNIRNLKMVAKVNEEVTCIGNSGDMYWAWEEIIEYCSQDETLYPGEFFGSGTVGGGCGAEIDKWIKPGDIIEMEIEGIGVLRNKVVKAKNTKLWRGKY
jgi:2-keto-4-pentenoate hydratase/2-oxohepta-3-ene-1,7-dioic acid hydratase in catechol pathway